MFRRQASTVVKVFDDIVANPGNKYTIEYRFKSKTGDYRWIRTTFSNLLSNKAINGFILNFTDITELKQMLEDIFKAKEKAEESDRLKSAFLANMSHEIRTPMNGILGFADLLKTPDLSGEKQQEYIQIIEKSGIRMLNIIKDIIDISKIESGQIDVHISPTNINENYSFLLNLFKPEAEKKGLKLRLKSVLPENEAIIKTDKEKVFAVLSNLIKNAIKFSFKGSIEFGLKKKDNYLEFYVKDMGVGIPQEHLKIIFERFRQGSESLSRNYEGAGLGLAISKAYVEILGGNIRAESEVGKGSTFYFTIPYESESIESKVITDQISESKEVNQINNLKVLIAEDDDTIEKLIAFKIKRYCKEIHIARNGLEAIQICRSHPDIDLVLMDIKMPVLNGYKATEQIRQFNKDVIIIAQTAYALSGDKDKAIKAGCNDYISKPYDYSKLNLLIEKYFV